MKKEKKQIDYSSKKFINKNSNYKKIRYNILTIKNDWSKLKN